MEIENHSQESFLAGQWAQEMEVERPLVATEASLAPHTGTQLSASISTELSSMAGGLLILLHTPGSRGASGSNGGIVCFQLCVCVCVCVCQGV